VLKELELYSPFVSKDSYLVVFDTLVEHLPKALAGDRPWGPGDNPKTAVHAFLKNNKDFVIAKTIQDKLKITAAPDGYLKRVR
jgi:cephalosporin hydroxylase